MDDILTKPLSRESLFKVMGHFVKRDSHHLHPHESASSLVNPQHLNDLDETLGAVALQSLLDRFGTEVDQTLTYLTQDHPLEEIAGHAHRIAGSAATLGAVYLRAALIEVEEAAKRQDIDAVREGVSRLPDVWATTRPLLKADGSAQ
jgi:HPt (histidine-containing phosphotransfer) domain-containing protein